MKKLLLILIFSGTVITLLAQTTQLWGVTSQGGSQDKGTIFRLDENGSNQVTEHNFEADYRQSTYPKFTLASDGLIYGLTHNGGSNDLGTIFTLDPISNTYSQLTSLSNSALGSSPVGEAVQCADGNFYFVALYGGINNSGSIMRFNPITSQLNKVYDFNSIGGYNAFFGLSLGANNKLYGVNRDGGANGDGTLFEFDPITLVYTKLHDFNIASFGGVGNGNVFMASSGKLIGVSVNGGTYDDGFIFEFDLTSSTFSILNSFQSTVSGKFPCTRLMEAGNGLVYGGASQGGPVNFNGTLFGFNPITNTFDVILDAFAHNVASPAGGLVQISANELIGFSTYSSYRLNISDNSVNIISSFPQTPVGTNNGIVPIGVPWYNGGMYYGYTDESAASASTGTVFYANSLSGAVNTIEILGGSPNGNSPLSGLTKLNNTKFYGSVSAGGTNNLGGIVSYDNVTNTSTLEHSFDLTGGSSVQGSMILASDGNFYGCTSENGNGGQGTIFRFNPTTGIYTSLHDFVPASGYFPRGSLIEVNGKLYGVLGMGGSQNGVLYQFDFNTNAISIIHNFSASSGSFPVGSLTYNGANNSLLGLTKDGGTAGFGVLYSFNLSSNVYSVLKNFVNSGTGLSPTGNVVISGGNIIGRTTTGGTSNYGTIFKYSPATDILTSIYSFPSAIGFGTQNVELLQLTNGRIFGVNSTGGTGNGYIFEVNATTNTVSTSYQFLSTAGSAPQNKLMEVEIPCLETTSSITMSECDSIISPSTNYIYYASGIYNDTIPNANGCDSIITISANISFPVTNDIYISTCDSYFWPANSVSYTTSGDYSTTFSTTAGCDSIVVLHLSIDYSTVSSQQVNSCNSYFWPLTSTTYTSSGNYSTVIPNSAGCDSTINLQLNISPFEADVFFTGTNLYTPNTGTYQWLNCVTNSIIAGETSSQYFPSISGDYAVIVNDGICTDTSDCINTTGLFVAETEHSAFEIYPNPVQSILKIEIDQSAEEINIIDAQGKMVYTLKIEEPKSELDLSHLEDGIYLIRIHTTNRILTRKFIKN